MPVLSEKGLWACLWRTAEQKETETCGEDWGKYVLEMLDSLEDGVTHIKEMELFT